VSKIAWSLFLFLMFAAAGPVFAADGITLINQSTVLGAGGFPYKITQSGSYKLTSNLIVPAGTDGIDILADHVTLDLNGFGIIGPVVCTGVLEEPTVCPTGGAGDGVSALSNQNNQPISAKVMNGSVRGMGRFGFFLQGAGSSVEGVAADSNGSTGIVVFGSVLASSATLNGASGILASIVRDCTAEQNVRDGIDLDGAGAVAIGNVALFNNGNGISAPNGSVVGNTMNLNKGFGLTGVCPSAIANNTIVSNSGGIMQLAQDGACQLANNAIR
jgi:hypothetical protein